jgi:general secretion pathway protein A
VSVAPFPSTKPAAVFPQRPDLPPYAAGMGLAAHPFPVTPDETHYYFTPQSEDIFAELRHFIELRKGFLLLTGDVGLGKTTLLRRLLGSFDRSRVNTALILTGFLDQAELLEAIARDFGLQLAPGARRFDHLDALYRFLLAESAAGKNNVLVIDDAQALDAEALDVVRQLSNFETADSKLIQIVLCGQPELREALDQHGLRQVKSRIAVSRQLVPLERDQVGHYIQHRLTAVGAAPLPIAPAAVDRLHALTGGFPRRIHHLMDRCLYALMAARITTLDAGTVDRAWADLGWDPVAAAGSQVQAPSTPATAAAGAAGAVAVAPKRRGPWMVPGLVGLLAGLGLLWLWGQRAPPAPAASDPPIASRTPNVLRIAPPAGWDQVRASYAGLPVLAWPDATSPADLQRLLAAELNRVAPGDRWQLLLAPGDALTPCPARPVLTLRDQAGTAWHLTFIESGLPTAAVALGEQRPILRGLQQYFNGRGWLVASSIDGVMGPQTVAALGRFQAEERITGTGQFDPATAYRLSCQLPAAVTGVPAPAAAAPGSISR